MKKIAFDDSFARTYRKRAEVLAFRTDAPLRFSKSWGEQAYRSSNGGFTSDNGGSDNSPGDLRLHPYVHATLWRGFQGGWARMAERLSLRLNRGIELAPVS